MPNLQILRFFAAAMVLVSHVQHEALKGKFAVGDYVPWDFMFFAGGVDIFFVISGFIIYAVGSGTFGNPGAAQKFMLRRMVRVAPPYWIFTSAMVLAAVLFQSHVTHSALDWDHILASYFFVPYNNAYGMAYPVLMLGYTLNFEVFFYAMFALAMVFPKKIGLLLLLGIMGSFGLAGLFQVPLPMPLSFWASPLVLEFLMGIGLAMLREKNFRLPAPAAWALVALGLGLMLLFKSLGMVGHDWHLRILWMGIPAMCICAGTVLTVTEVRPLSRFKNLLVLLGDASYAIYLSHPFSLNAVALVWKHLGPINAWVYVCTACLVSVLVGVAAHLWMEKPMTRYLNGVVERRWKRRQGGAIQPA